MTNEEAGIIIGNIPIPLVILGTNDKCYSLTEYQEAKAMAIKALEQQACEDAVSRGAVKAYAYHRTMYPNFEDYVDKLPPVTPKKKTGKWIEKWDSDHLVILAYECSKCGMMMNVNTSHYCPNCGARMKVENG